MKLSECIVHEYIYEISEMDVLLVLGHKNVKERLKTTAEIWKYGMEKRTSSNHSYVQLLPIIAVGSLGSKTEPEISSEDMKNQLVNYGVMKQLVFCGPESKDTLGALVRAWPIVEKCPKVNDGDQELGFVTEMKDAYHTAWLSRRLYGKSREITIFPTDEKYKFRERLKARASNVVKRFSLRGIKSGDQKGFEAYVTSQSKYGENLGTNYTHDFRIKFLQKLKNFSIDGKKL